MIVYNVAQLLKSPTGTDRKIEFEDQDPELAAELGLVSPSRGSLRLVRTSAGILVKGKLTHTVEESCCRCLEPFRREQTIALDDEFLPVVDVDTGLPVTIDDPEGAPESFRLTSDHCLDLSEAIRQYGILEDPLQPLCSSECKGLCSECGANLNLGPCGCRTANGTASVGAFGALLSERMRQAGFKTEEE